MKNIITLKKEHRDSRGWMPCVLDTSYLRYPLHQTVKILDDGHKELILKQAEFAVYNSMEDLKVINMGFNDSEVQKIIRTYDWSLSEDENLIQNRIDFIKFVDEHDIRRGTDFLKTFPEMEEFYHKIKDKI
jgi:hypothetical protein